MIWIQRSIYNFHLFWFQRSIDSNSFISDSANYALCAMIEHTTASKCIMTLLQCGAEHKTAGIRSSTTGCVSHAVRTRSSELKTSAGSECLTAVQDRLTKLVSDPSPDVRAHSREIIRRLINGGFVSRSQLEVTVLSSAVDKALQEQPTSFVTAVMSRFSSSDDDSGKVNGEETAGELRREAMSPRRRPPNKGDPTNGGSPRARLRQGNPSKAAKSELASDSRSAPAAHGGNSPRVELGVSGHGSSSSGLAFVSSPAAAGSVASPAAGSGAGAGSKYSALQTALAKKQMESIEELANLPDIMQRLSSKNWLERNEAITLLTNAIISNTEILTTARKLEQLVDCILEKLEDGSIKVRNFEALFFGHCW